MRIQAREQGRSRRATPGSIVELRETKPFGGQMVEVRRPDLRTVTAQIGETEIVSENFDRRFGVQAFAVPFADFE